MSDLQQRVEKLEAENAELRQRLLGTISGCPFDYPNNIEPEDPCPVCGGLGTPDAENHCPYPPKNTIRRTHKVAA